MIDPTPANKLSHTSSKSNTGFPKQLNLREFETTMINIPLSEASNSEKGT
jgi:hypothetical protein